MSKCMVQPKGTIEVFEVAWIDFDNEQICIKKHGRREVVSPDEIKSVEELFISVR